MRHAPLIAALLGSASLCACSAAWKPPAISYDDTPRQAVLEPNPPKPVQIVELPKPLPLPGQLKRLRRGAARAAGAGRSAPARRGGQPRGTRPADPRRLPERDPGLSVLRRRALPGLCRPRRDHRHRAAAGRKAHRLRTGRGRRHGALDHRRDRQRDGGIGARAHSGQADAAGPRHQPRHQHRPTHLSSRAALGPEDLHGVGVLGLSRGPADRACAGRTPRPRRRRRSRPASISARSTSATASKATIRPGGRCAPSTTGGRCSSSSRAASARARCRRSGSIGPAGGGELVNYRVQGNHMIVDRLFAAAELRLGGEHQQVVRIVRTDGRPQS